MYHPHRQQLHFVGIGGVGMAGIAEVLLNLGYSVTGSDLKRSSYTDHLEKHGAKIYFGHKAENLSPTTTVVVRSSAVGDENPEVEEAKRQQIPVLPRAEMLAELMRMKYGIGIAGAHGKTTTTTMVGHLLEAGGLDPTVIVGGRVLSRPSGARVGLGEYLVAEADESDGSFTKLRPAIAVVTNIDQEHLSHYGTFGKLEEAFRHFCDTVPFYGLVVGCIDDPLVRTMLGEVGRRTLSYGFSPDAFFSAKSLEVVDGGTKFTLLVQNEEIGEYFLPMPGRHMVLNALASIAVGYELGIEVRTLATALETFPGVARRSEVVTQVRGITVIDDYGHHPTEIQATLEGIKNAYFTDTIKKSGRLIVLFQPHRYSRTKELFSQFLNCFNHADVLYIGEIYSAGEDPIPAISGMSLGQAIVHSQVHFSPDLKDAVPEIISNLTSGDVVLTLGAGNVSQLSKQLASELKL
jgi:UDP-N-acetylmuramate--alanine ligase